MRRYLVILLVIIAVSSIVGAMWLDDVSVARRREKAAELRREALSLNGLTATQVVERLGAPSSVEVRRTVSKRGDAVLPAERLTLVYEYRVGVPWRREVVRLHVPFVFPQEKSEAAWCDQVYR